MKLRLRYALAFGALSLSPAFAADIATPAPGEATLAEQPQAPGDDIFGFTSPSDTGNVGEKSFSLESTTRFGKGNGLYVTPSVKIEFGYAIAENVWVALSPFVTNYRIRDVAGIDNLSRTRFDGLSSELIWRFLPRTPYGLAASFSVEPRWAQLDGVSGLGVNALSAEFKFYIDQVIIPDQLFAALNLNYQPGAQQAFAAGSPWVSGSATNVSAGLTWQITPSLFVGAEVRYLGVFDGAYLNRTLGTALFVGPNLTVKFSEKTALNIAWTPQISGDANGIGGRLDLINFERHQLRVKFASAL